MKRKAASKRAAKGSITSSKRKRGAAAKRGEMGGNDDSGAVDAEAPAARGKGN